MKNIYISIYFLLFILILFSSINCTDKELENKRAKQLDNMRNDVKILGDKIRQLNRELDSLRNVLKQQDVQIKEFEKIQEELEKNNK